MEGGSNKQESSPRTPRTVYFHRSPVVATALDLNAWPAEGLDWAGLDSTRLDSTRLDSTRLDSTVLDWTRQD